MSTLSKNLRKAAKLQDKIEQLTIERDTLLDNLGTATKVDGRRGPKGKGKGKRRKMSKAGRAKISAAAKLRWKKAKAAGKKKL
jgi:hypothetical protein